MPQETNLQLAKETLLKLFDTPLAPQTFFDLKNCFSVHFSFVRELFNKFLSMSTMMSEDECNSGADKHEELLSLSSVLHSLFEKAFCYLRYMWSIFLNNVAQ